MHCLDDVPAPETPPPLPDTHPSPGTSHPPAPPPLDDDEPLPPPMQLPGRPGLPERVAAGRPFVRRVMAGIPLRC